MPSSWKLRGYVVEQLLGSGASGEVWQARVAASGEPVALKRLVVADPDQARRARSEAALLGALDHPHLVRLHALVPDDGVAVLVLDLAAGGSLADLLVARGRLTPGEVITAVAPIAAALAYAHGHGVVHSDVSPGNVLFTNGGIPLLADLGVARLTGDDADAESTPAYVDPAVAAGCVPGPQSDVFMLGGVALHALTGAPPWAEPTAEAALAAARSGVLDDVADRLAQAGVPEAMAVVVCRALAVDPHRRGTAADFALDLRHSGQPVAVELAAGLPRRERALPGGEPTARPRHAARPGAVPVVDESQPVLEWRKLPPGVIDAPAPTSAVGPRPRPVIPRPRRRRFPSRVVVVLAVAVLAAALVAGGVLRWRAERSRPAADPPPRSPSVDATGTPSADWPAVLVALDALRARAFATRDTNLLRRVYVPGVLLSADTALLTRMVPPGCGLVGARTHYDGVQVAVHGASVRVTALVTLPASTLVCPGKPTRRADGAGPATVHLELAHTRAGPRIARQQVS